MAAVDFAVAVDFALAVDFAVAASVGALVHADLHLLGCCSVVAELPHR